MRKVLSMTRPESPLPIRGGRSLRIQHRRRTAIVVGAAGMLFALMVGYIRYEMTHDLPNPYWGIFGTSYTYTFQEGPPGVGLVDTRPDEIVSRYIHDYIGVAGTFPCVATLATYGQDPFPADPVRSGKHCTVNRLVAGVHIGSTHVITIRRALPISSGSPAAIVSYRIDYIDGEHLEGEFQLIADLFRSQPYFRTQIHANCWFFFEALGFYPYVVTQPPRGIEYHITGEADTRCAGFE